MLNKEIATLAAFSESARENGSDFAGELELMCHLGHVFFVLSQRMLNLLYTRKLEVCVYSPIVAASHCEQVVLVGLENSGKTTLLHVLAAGRPVSYAWILSNLLQVETCPTIGLNVKLLRKGGVQMKCWDIGGQAQCVKETKSA